MLSLSPVSAQVGQGRTLVASSPLLPMPTLTPRTTLLPLSPWGSGSGLLPTPESQRVLETEHVDTWGL